MDGLCEMMEESVKLESDQVLVSGRWGGTASLVVSEVDDEADSGKTRSAEGRKAERPCGPLCEIRCIITEDMCADSVDVERSERTSVRSTTFDSLQFFVRQEEKGKGVAPLTAITTFRFSERKIRKDLIHPRSLSKCLPKANVQINRTSRSIKPALIAFIHWCKDRPRRLAWGALHLCTQVFVHTAKLGCTLERDGEMGGT